MPSCVGVDSSPRLGGRGPRPSSLPHILSDHRRPPVAGSVAPGSRGRLRGGRFVWGGPCVGRFSHTKWATQIRPLTGLQGTLVGRPTAAAPRGAPPVRAWLPPRLGLGGVPVPGLAVPSVGRGSPSPVRPAMAGCLGISGPAGRPCSTAPVEIYIHPVPCAGVRQWTVVTVHLSICLYIHTYIYIYIYTRRYWWMHLDTRYIARRQQSTLLPPALAPLVRTSLCPVVAPRWGLTPVPGDHSGPPPTGQYPGLPPPW